MGVPYFTKEEIPLHKERIRTGYAKGSWIIHLENKDKRVSGVIVEKYGLDADILELGSGAGHTLKLLEDLGFKNFNGVDIDNYLTYPELNNRLLICDLNQSKIPVEDASQDVVMAFEIIEHLENPFRFEREIARVLKPGGILFLSTPYGHTLWDKLKFCRSGNLVNFHRKNNHITFLTRDIFAKTFYSNFKLISQFWNHGWIPFLRPRRFNKLLPPHPLWSLKTCYILEKK